MRSAVLVGVLSFCFVAFGADAAGAQGRFGLGVIVGEPTGVDGKLFVGDSNAVEGAIAWSFSGDTELHLQGDYLYHFYGVFQVDRGRLPLFAGLGGRLKFRDGADDQLGLRIPAGIAYHFEKAPFDVFGEIVPILELSPDTDFSLEGAVGVRFYF